MSDSLPVAPIMLKSEIQDIQQTERLERYVTLAGHDVRRRANAPMIEDEISSELALHVYAEFLDIATTNRLSLGTGPLKFEFFRHLLKGNARSHWDSAADGVGGNTNNNFAEAIVVWLSNYMEPTAHHDQKQYLLSAVKPYSLNCKLLSSRLKKIKTLMQCMPGAPDNADDIYREPEWKILFYNMMRPNWKAAFDASGNTITTDTYSFESLVMHMCAQEKQERTTRAPRGGRGGRGGRNEFRGRGGRGYRGGRHQGYKRNWNNYAQGNYQSGGNYQGGPAVQRPRYCSNAYQQGYGRGGRAYSPRAGHIQRAPYRGRSGCVPRGGRGRGRSYAPAPGAAVPFDAQQCHIQEQPEAHAIEPTTTGSGAEVPHNYPQEPVEEVHWADDVCGAFEHAPEEYEQGYGDY